MFNFGSQLTILLFEEKGNKTSFYILNYFEEKHKPSPRVSPYITLFRNTQNVLGVQHYNILYIFTVHFTVHFTENVQEVEGDLR